MDKFEERLGRAAIRIRDRENAKMELPPNPRKSTRPTWGWIGAPAAAAVGLLAGMFIQGIVVEKGSQQVVVRTDYKIDTVVKERVVRDTVYVASSRESVSMENRVAMENRRQLPVDTMGKNILNDGVDYSMLAVY